MFDPKYETVIQFKYEDCKDYLRMIEWVQSNSSGSIDIKFVTLQSLVDEVYVAFENKDDATFFKIKYII